MVKALINLLRHSEMALLIEGGLLLLATPFLVFPTQFYPLTIIALGVVIWLLVWPLWSAAHPRLPATPYSIPLLLWSITLGVSITVTADPWLTLPKATNLILSLTLWVWGVRWLTKRPAWLSGGILAFIGAAMAFVLVGILGANWEQRKVPFLDGVLDLLPSRLIALPENATVGIHLNQVAGVLVLLLPIILSWGLAAWQQQKKSRWGWLGAALLLGFLLLLTQSRFGWFGGVGSLLTLLLLWALLLPPSLWRRRLQNMLATAVTLSLLGIILINPSRLWQNPADETVIGSFSSFSFRQEVWQWAVQTVADFPLTGIGLGTFRLAVERLYPIEIPRMNDIAHAHNMLLQVAVDVGIVGVIAYVTLLLLVCYSGWAAVQGDKGQAIRPFVLGLIAGLVGLHLFFGLGDALAPGSKPNVLIWLAFMLLAVIGQQRPLGSNDNFHQSANHH